MRKERTPLWGYHCGWLGPNPPRDLREMVWNRVKEGAGVCVHQLLYCGLKAAPRGGEGVVSLIPRCSFPPCRWVEKLQCPQETLGQ